MVGDTVRAFGGADDGSPLAYDLGGGAETFHSLIQILIQGIAGVGGNDNIKRLINGIHGAFFDELAADAMSLDHVTGKDVGDFLIAVEGHIQHKMRFGHQAVLRCRILEDVALDEAPGAVGVTDHLGIVKIKYRLNPGNARLDSFGTAGKSGEKVGFDKAGDDFEGGVDIGLVEKYIRALRVSAHMHQFFIIKGVVVFDGDGVNHFLTQHENQFVPGVGPVGA